MTEYQEKAIAAIEAQQAKAGVHSKVWAVGEQLKCICMRESASAELIAQDLAVEGMSISDAEKKVAAFARKNSGFASLDDADRILREFYGLPAFERNHALLEFYGLPSAGEAVPGGLPPELGGHIDPLDFL